MVDDLRNSLRALLRRPGFSIAVTLLLGLGIGATAAVFALADTYLLRPLPYVDAARIVSISEGRTASRDRFGLQPDHVSLLQQEARSFDRISAYVAGGIGFDVMGRDGAVRVQGGAASADLFDLLGTRPVLGRLFLETDEVEETAVVVVGHGFWQRYLAGDRQVIGRTILVSGVSRQVVGVLPPDAAFPEIEIWVPQPLRLSYAVGNPLFTTYSMRILARLREGVTLEQARDEMRRLSRSLSEVDPYAAKTGMVFHVTPFRDVLVGELGTVLWVLFGSVGFVLLITCTNVSNLFLGRLITRQPELTMRAVLGASRLRLARQLLFECICLGLLAAGLGLLLGKLGLDLLLPFAAPLLPHGEVPRIDLRVLGFMLGTALLCGILSGIAPVLARTLKKSPGILSEGSPSRPKARRLWGLLVVLQLALAFVLLAGEGLMLRSFQALSSRPLGFEPANVLTFDLFLSKHEYATSPERLRFLQEVISSLSSLPGTHSVSVSTGLPIAGGGLSEFVLTSDQQEAEDLASLPRSDCWHVSPSFFSTLGIPLLRGRAFTTHDTLSSMPVVILDESLAHRFWPGEPTLGKRVKISGVWREVVGIAGKVANRKPHGESAPLLYAPLTQLHMPLPEYHVALRTVRDPMEAAAAETLDVIRHLNPRQAVYGITTMEARVVATRSRERLTSLVLGIYSVLGLGLALTGIFALVRFAAVQRRKEIGIRIALGAARRDVLSLVLREGLSLIMLGLCLGAGAAWLSTKALARLVYGGNPGEPMTLAGIAFALAVMAIIAALLPGVETLRADPVSSMRTE